MAKTKDPYSALEAKNEAQKLSFSPIVFQAAQALRQLGILAILDEAGDEGLSALDVSDRSGVSEYGVKVLLDMAESAGIVLWEKPSYSLGKFGFFLLHDSMTNVNMNFTDDVCYAAMKHLKESIVEGRPAGLKELGDWETIYEGLSILPEPAKKSWFDFDHFYSDRSFPVILKEIFSSNPKEIVDIGGNTGKWALQCLNYDSDVKVTIVDLPIQLNVAMNNIAQTDFSDRFTAFPANMLDDQQALPENADVWWMSQFLDCFSPIEILNILKKVKSHLRPGDAIYIMELFCDAQKYDAASYSLNATSLYFTCLANGNSRFYRSDDFLEIVQEAGLTLDKRIDDIGLGHTLLKLKL